MRHRFFRALALLLCALLIAPCRAGALTLREGDEDELSYALNARLYALGFLSEAPGARFTAATREAVRLAQEYLDIDPTGDADEDTRARVMDDELLAAVEAMDATPGDEGPHVRRVQTRLRTLNLYKGAPGGVYDAATAEAVRAFQTHMAARGVALDASGVADAPTRAALFGDLHGCGIRAPQFYDEIAPDALTGEYLYAESVILLIGDSVLLEKNADARRAPASLTKLLTTLVMLDILSPDDAVTVHDEAEWTPDDASLTPVFAGETMTARDLLYATLLPSGDDAARALALACAPDLDAFLTAMRARAAALDMTDTTLVTVDGYPAPGHESTARDMARLLAAALSRDELERALGTFEYDMPPTEYRGVMTIAHTAEPLDPDSPCYDPRVTAVKTGYCAEAGYCAALAAQIGDARLLCVILGAPTSEARWQDARRLLNAGAVWSGL